MTDDYCRSKISHFAVDEAAQRAFSAQASLAVTWCQLAVCGDALITNALLVFVARPLCRLIGLDVSNDNNPCRYPPESAIFDFPHGKLWCGESLTNSEGAPCFSDTKRHQEILSETGASEDTWRHF